MNDIRGLASLLMPLTPASRRDHKTTQILLGFQKSDDDDEAHVQLFSRILSGLKSYGSLNAAKDSPTTLQDANFDTLYEELPFKWDEEEV